jgi:hypothetical protein
VVCVECSEYVPKTADEVPGIIDGLDPTDAARAAQDTTRQSRWA